MLGKQMRFDLSILRDNPLKYIMFALQTIMCFLIGIYNYSNRGVIFSLIVLFMILIMFLYMVNISTVFEKHGWEFVVNKLIFYPTTRSINLLSKAILLLMFVGVQIMLNSFAVYIGAIATGNEGITVKLNIINNLTLLAGAFCFVKIWGIHSMRAVLLMSCYSIPIYFVVISVINIRELDIVDVILFLIIFIIDLVINIYNYIRSKTSI